MKIKKHIIVLLTILLFTLALPFSTVGAETDITIDDTNIYIENNEVSSNGLIDTISSIVSDEEIGNLIENNILKTKKYYKVSSLEYQMDENTLIYTLDEEPITPGSTVTITSGSHTIGISFDYHAEYAYKKSIISKTNNESYDSKFSVNRSINILLSYKTTISLKKTSYTINYGEEVNEQMILDYLAPSVKVNNTGELIANPEFKIVGKINNLDVGTYDITVRYTGFDNLEGYGYQPCEIGAKIYVRKASSSIKVSNTIVTYDGEEHRAEVITEPGNISYVALTAGIQGDASGFASIYMNEGNSLYKALVFLRDSGDTLSYLARLVGIDISKFILGSEGVTLTQLKDLLTNISSIGGLLSTVGIDITNTQIDGLLEAIEAISKLIPDINVHFFVKNAPKNQGLYVTYAVINDDNYNTKIAFGNTTILPAFKISMHWNDDINDYLKENNDLSKFDFSAFVSQKDAQQAQGENAEVINANIKYSFTGVNYAGKPFLSNSLDKYPTEPGIYTENAYVTYNYVTANVRTFTIPKFATSIKFVNESGEYVDSIVSSFENNNAEALKAVVLDANGEVVEGAKISFKYNGTSYDSKKYSSTKLPSKSGTYTVTANYTGNGKYLSSSNANGTIIIEKGKATIKFGDISSKILKKVDYSQIKYEFEGMTQEEAARIAATLDCDSKIHLLVGTHSIDVKIPSDLAAKYDITVIPGKHTVKLF